VFFIPLRSLQICCSPACAIKKAQLDRVKIATNTAKKERREHRAAKEKAKPLAWFAGSAQTVFNKFIRMRDAELPCISCGCGNIKYVSGQPKVTSWDCGHYMSRGSTPALKMEPLNCAKQCVACNQYNHGNLVNYRVELINRIGLDQVLWLEGPHQPKKYTVDDYKEIKRVYSAKLKELLR
jgi:hypothetical protein